MMLSRVGKFVLAASLFMGTSGIALAGGQKYEPMSASARAHLSKALADVAVTEVSVLRVPQTQAWLAEMSRRLAKRIPDEDYRMEFLQTLYYEATRAGLDPELMLGLIQVESGFKKYAVSPVGARGFTQVMPFWLKLIGVPEHNLFHLRTNLRYGALILRHYIDIEKGDLYRALGRYNGSLGKPEYPTLVVGAWQKNWRYTPPIRTAKF
jgi:soluble lytic murein transglycosylase-like protein